MSKGFTESGYVAKRYEVINAIERVRDLIAHLKDQVGS